jgi:hypothetical protein
MNEKEEQKYELHEQLWEIILKSCLEKKITTKEVFDSLVTVNVFAISRLLNHKSEESAFAIIDDFFLNMRKGMKLAIEMEGIRMKSAIRSNDE